MNKRIELTEIIKI